MNARCFENTSSPKGRLVRLGFVLALAPLLAGCAAAVALPLLAGGAFLVRDKVRVRAATPVPAVTVSEMDATAAGAVVTPLTELPPPTAADIAAIPPWTPFVDYALGQAMARQRESALIWSDSLMTPSRRTCLAAHPAVILDLDGGERPFAPEQAARASPGLAEGLARLRAANVAVLWIAQVPSTRVAEVAAALRSSGLDPGGHDQFLLIRDGEDRKQVLREQAGEDVCVVAIAGDRKADFDELFDYLRNPDAAIGLDAMLGHGWFLTPLPLAPAAP